MNLLIATKFSESPASVYVVDPWWSFWLMALLAIFFVGALAMLFHMMRRPQQDTRMQWRVSLVLMSALVAVLCSLVGVMPGTQASLANLVGPAGAATYTMGGSFAMWVIAFYVLVKLLHAELPQNMSYEEWVVEVEGRSGYLGYHEWLNSLGHCKAVVEENDWAFMNELLPKAFYRGPLEYNRPTWPRIDTLFIYGLDKTVKIQRITSSHISEDETFLYDPTSPSSANGAATSGMLEVVDGIVRCSTGRRGQWYSIPGGHFDRIIVALYDNDHVPQGDYVHLDAAKYLNVARPSSRNPTSEFGLFVISARKIADPSVQWWEMRSSQALTRTPVPVIFRRLAAGVLNGPPNVMASIRDRFGGWLDLLFDNSVSSDIEVDSDLQVVLDECKRLATESGLSSAGAVTEAPYFAYGITGRSDSVVACLFAWDRPIERQVSRSANGERMDSAHDLPDDLSGGEIIPRAASSTRIVRPASNGSGSPATSSVKGARALQRREKPRNT